MKKINIELFEVKEQVQQFAITWQEWASKESISYSEMAEWQEYFTTLANKFNLVEEFTENGII